MSGSLRPSRIVRAAGWSTSVQAVPPALSSSIVHRPRLEDRLEQATARRLTVIVAGAGAGKSTLLADWAVRRGAAWYTLTETDRDLMQLGLGILGALALRVPALTGAVAGLLERTLGPEAAGDERSRARACAALVADALASFLTRDLVLVLDDFQEVGPGDPSTWLIEALCRQAPERLHIVISTREPLPFSVERLRGQGQATSLSAASLSFERPEIAAILELGLGSSDPELVEELERVTGGWPAAVRLAMEALTDLPPDERRSMLGRFLRPAGAIYDYLAGEVLGRASPEVRALLAAVAPLPRFSADLCTAIGIGGAGSTIRSLEERGLFVQPLGEGDWFTLHPLIREYLVARAGRHDGPPPRLAEAATWFEAQGAHRDALTCWAEAADLEAVARVLEDHGAEMLTGGDVETVIGAAAVLPDTLRSETIERVEGEARQIRGDWEGALACFRRLAPEDREIDPGIAWRMGLIHHLRGELNEALRTYRRGRTADGEDLRDVALLRSWTASALWLQGDRDACRANASAALDDAVASGDDQALAAAHTIAAMVAALDGDRRANDAHYLRALDHATRSGDVLQAIRIRANRGSRLVEEGYYEEAIDELRAAIALAEVAGFAAFHALALSNRGEALRRLGRFEEAISDLEAARQLYQRLESRLVAYPLGHLGDVHAERGALAVARACFEEAIAVAEASRDVQGLRPSLAGLAELVVGDEPDRATALAGRAVAFGPGIGLVRALVGRGRVALARDPGEAGRRAAAEDALEAAAEARTRRDRAGLAEALELRAGAAAETALARGDLEEALQLWRDLHCPVAAARVEVRLDEPGGGPASEEAERVLKAAGAARHRSPDVGKGVAAGGAPAAASVQVLTFGGFEVVRDGRTVATAEWGSKKARDLFKILITRRGRHVPREQLQEILWPADDGARAGRRLSVAVSTVRAVLDPGHLHPAAHFVAADRDAVWIEREHLAIDLETFLADAADGLAKTARGSADAVAALRSAEAAHRGEFLVEDAFEDWAAGLREECRQAYIGVGHRLARLAGDDGDHETAARYLRRVLERDEFDEGAHLALVAALAAGGHPADARRAYGAYMARMEELGVEAAPFPD